MMMDNSGNSYNQVNQEGDNIINQPYCSGNRNGNCQINSQGDNNSFYGGTHYHSDARKDGWLQPYDPGDDNEIKWYINEQWVGKIENNLCNKKVCLIKASEGRGKTFLSRIIAQKYSEKGYEVWFGDITKPDASGESLKQWCKDKKTNCLVILENLHACKSNDELECLIDSINTMRKPLWYNNGNNKLLFLLNARPTSEDFDTIMSDLGDNVTEKLEPDIEYCKGVASLSSRPIDDKALDNFLKNKRFGFNKGNANLRLLRIVIEIWETDTDNSLSSIQDVNQKKIILKFKTKYDLDLLGETEKGYLMFLSSIFQFDIPLPEELLISEEIDFLKRLCNKKHLVIYKDYKFYMPHSVDASYLSKAIGGRQCIEQTQEKILDIVARILNYKAPRDFEGDFILLIQGLVQRKEEFQVLINDLTEWNRAREIIMKVNPGFILSAANTQNHSKEEILESYMNEKEDLIEYIFQMTPGALVRLCLAFDNHLEYGAIYTDIFNDINIDKISDYLEYWSSKYNTSSIRRIFSSPRINRKIRELSPALIEQYLGPPSVQYDYAFNTPHSSPKQYCISNKTINRYYSYCQNEIGKAEWCLGKINKKEGFYFENCSWYHLGKMIYSIRSIANDKNMEICRNAVRKIVHVIMDEIKQDPVAVQKAKNEQLSLFFSAVSNIDEDVYKTLMKDRTIVNEVKNNRLFWFEYSSSYLYLFSHFYSQDWCKEEMNLLIEEANEEQVQVIKKWYIEIKQGLDKGNRKIEQGTLLDYIHDKFFSGQQNKLIPLQPQTQTNMKKAFILLVLAFAAFALRAQEMKTLTWSGQTREYLEYVPSTYSEETPAPVLFMLHGLGDQATNFFNATNISAIAERKGWIVVCPQAMPFDIEIPYVGTYPFGSSWGAGITVTVNFQLYGIPLNFDVTVNPDADDSGFLMAALQTLGEEYNLEQDSVFFAGFSLGACMAHRMAIEHGERINAIAAVSGVVGNDMVGVTPTANVNVLEVFGTNDEMISYDSAIISLQGYGTPSIGLPAEQSLEFWRAFNQCDTNPIVEEYPDTQNDGLTFEMYGYPNGANDSHVAFLKVNNGMHRWYTGSSYDIDYTEEIIRFFTGTLDVTNVTEQSEKALSVYPNPATSFIQVDTQDEVSVYDLCGKLVLQGNGSSRIDVSSLPEGMYFVKTKSSCNKLVINR